MSEDEIRIECLRLACMGSAARTAMDQNQSVIDLAKDMFEFVKPSPEPLKQTSNQQTG